MVPLSSINSTQQPLSGRRSFSSNSILFKGKGSKTKKAKARQAEEDEDEDANEAQETMDDPFDFSILDEGVRKALEKLKNDLSKLRTGGRFNPEVLESLRVHLNKDSKHSERLGDLAQVLPKGGRSLMILVGEKDVSFVFQEQFFTTTDYL
jgi:ribosome recycling factor